MKFGKKIEKIGQLDPFSTSAIYNIRSFKSGVRNLSLPITQNLHPPISFPFRVISALKEPLVIIMATLYPESRVLIIMTGGTICMRSSPEGLVPARGFLKEGMRPRPSFNDGSDLGKDSLRPVLVLSSVFERAGDF